jgi:hypothetical protein
MQQRYGGQIPNMAKARTEVSKKAIRITKAIIHYPFRNNEHPPVSIDKEWGDAKSHPIPFY